MSLISSDNICAHPDCSCPPNFDGHYCSMSCQSALDESICQCGHSECQATT